MKKDIEIFDIFDVYWDRTTQRGQSIFGSYSIMWSPDYEDCASLDFCGVCERSPYDSGGCVVIGSRIKYTDLEDKVREHHRKNVEWNKKRLLNYYNNINPAEPRRQALINDIEKMKQTMESLEAGAGGSMKHALSKLEKELIRMGYRNT